MMNIFLETASYESFEKLLTFSEQLHAHDALDFDKNSVNDAFVFLKENPFYGDIFSIVYKETEAEEIIGYVVLCYSFSLEHCAKVATIDQFYLAPNYRRQKIGTHILPNLEQKAKENGCNMMNLKVNIGNAGVRQFYEIFEYLPHRQDYFMSKKLH